MEFIGAVPIVLLGLWCLVLPDVVTQFYVWLRGRPLRRTRLTSPPVIRVMGFVCLLLVLFVLLAL
jgi:hypothetical protein